MKRDAVFSALTALAFSTFPIGHAQAAEITVAANSNYFSGWSFSNLGGGGRR